MWSALVKSLLPAKWRILAYVAAGVVAFVLIRRIPDPREDPRVIVATEQALKQGKAFRAQIEQDRKTIGRLSRKAEAQMKVADSLRRVSDSIPLPTLTPAACAPWATKLTLCQAEADTLRAAVASKDSIIEVDSLRRQRAENRADTLESLLKKNSKRGGLLGKLDPQIFIEFQKGEKPVFGVELSIPF
jgi:hypothetical protein